MENNNEFCFLLLVFTFEVIKRKISLEILIMFSITHSLVVNILFTNYSRFKYF